MDVISCSQCQRTPALVQDIRGCHLCQSNGQASRVHARYLDGEPIDDVIARAVGLVVVQHSTDELPPEVAKEFDPATGPEYTVWTCPADGDYLWNGDIISFRKGEVLELSDPEAVPVAEAGKWPFPPGEQPEADEASEKAPVTPNPDADETSGTSDTGAADTQQANDGQSAD